MLHHGGFRVPRALGVYVTAGHATATTAVPNPAAHTTHEPTLRPRFRAGHRVGGGRTAEGGGASG
ncbi:hypothetical protein, partial [Subtercola vilae]|uniref:hypothetical protein n=1 Tax=Subtercola vilae TaxID=2056433 RepID=UPI001F1DABD5